MDKDRILNVNRAAETFWLVATVLISIVTGYIIYTEGYEENQFLPLIPTLAGVWYVIRRTFRKRLERDLGK
tara:strand:+ start:347 stop:559 length:213 start_codon:yes stop_codon:yes gene_type:complete